MITLSRFMQFVNLEARVVEVHVCIEHVYKIRGTLVILEILLSKVSHTMNSRVITVIAKFNA